MKIEILAPAGSYESMRAAMNAGCDAVYMGETDSVQEHMPIIRMKIHCLKLLTKHILEGKNCILR